MFFCPIKTLVLCRTCKLVFGSVVIVSINQSERICVAP